MDSAGGRPTVHSAQIEQLFQTLDTQGNGGVNVLEFCAAFVPGEQETRAAEPETEPSSRRQLSHGVVQSVCTTIWAHRWASYRS